MDQRTQTLVDINTVARTTDDMTAAAKWKHGQTIYGTQAKKHAGWKNYRKDINTAFGQEGVLYKDKYVDTLSKKLLSEQIKDIERGRG